MGLLKPLSCNCTITFLFRKMYNFQPFPIGPRLNLEAKLRIAALSKQPQHVFVDLKVDSKRPADHNSKVDTPASNMYPDGGGITFPYDRCSG